MHLATAFLLTSATIASRAVASPFSFPLADGFPNPNATALQKIFKLAGGTLPNTPLPTSLTAAATQTLQLVAANEQFEVAYFSELLSNITKKVPGYECEPHVAKSIEAVVNQEELHALGANAILSTAKKTTIQPCKYDFPVDDLSSAMALAETFTNVVLGVLPSAQTTFATDGGDETGLVQLLGSIIAQEGEQVGLYRTLQKKVASAAPFLTGGAAQFAYTAISHFIVPGSCPNLNVIGLTAFPALTVETTPKPYNSTQLFSINGTVSATSASIAYISGQNFPVTVPITNVNTQGGKTYFFASFPYESGFARGLTIAALVSGSKPAFNTSAQVAAATLYGPALIEVD